MRVAIVGLPMCGKTTLFRLLTGGGGEHHGGVQAEVRRAVVHDPRLDRLAEDFSPKKVTPATIDFMDFPPVVRPGGGERKSCADLLAPAREAGALIVVVRSFESVSVPPVRGSIDPTAELAEVVEELRLADLEVASRRLERVRASLPKKRGDDRRELEEELPLVERVVAHLEEGGDIQDLDLSGPDEKRLRGFQFLSAKPRLVVENIGEGAGGQVAAAIPVAIALEQELEELDADDRALFEEEYGFTEPARERVIAEIYRRAGLVSFLTAGEPEVRAWTVPAALRAQDAAGTIHSDIARGFIRAEVVAYDDYVADGGMAGAKEHGHLRLEGKDYPVQDGDIVLFRFNV